MKDFDKLKRKARKLRADGFTMAQIGRQLDCNKAVIFKWVRDVEFDGYNALSIEEQRHYCHDDLREQAIDLRRQGWSYKMILEQIKVSKSTLSLWLRDVPMETEVIIEERHRVGRAKRAKNTSRYYLQKRIAAQREADIRYCELIDSSFSNRELFLLGLALYWGEGAKTGSNVSVSNSDPEVIKLFMHWMKQCFGITQERFRLQAFIYPDLDELECINYWYDVTKIPMSQCYAPIVDRRENKNLTKRGKLRYGTVHVTVIGKGSTYLLCEVLRYLELLKQDVSAGMA